jgi:hypothetical protein
MVISTVGEQCETRVEIKVVTTGSEVAGDALHR